MVESGPNSGQVQVGSQQFGQQVQLGLLKIPEGEGWGRRPPLTARVGKADLGQETPAELIIIEQAVEIGAPEAPIRTIQPSKTLTGRLLRLLISKADCPSPRPLVSPMWIS